MPKLKKLSGQDLIKIFSNFNFLVVSQKGSHIKLKNISPNNTKQILIIPNHKDLDMGTIKAIYRQSLKYIPESKLYSLFYL